MKCEFTSCVKVEIKISDKSDPNKVIDKLLEYIYVNHLFGSTLYSGPGGYVGLHTEENANKIKVFLKGIGNG